MGESGAVSWMFHKKWVIFIDPSHYDYETIEELVYETAAEDIQQEAQYIKIICSLDDYHDIEKFFEEKNIDLLESKIDFIPDNELEISDFDQALKFTKLIEAKLFVCQVKSIGSLHQHIFRKIPFMLWCSFKERKKDSI